MEMDRDSDFLLQSGDEFFRGQRFAETGHVLDGKDVRAHLFNLLGLRDVVAQRILVALRVGDVAGVADRCLTKHLAMLADCLHGDFHVGQVVERVKDSEDVHAAIGRVLHEACDDVVRVVRVADGIRAAEKHLEAEVRGLFAKAAKAFPRTLLEEAHRSVEGRAAPVFQREELRRAVCDGPGDA